MTFTRDIDAMPNFTKASLGWKFWWFVMVAVMVAMNGGGIGAR